MSRILIIAGVIGGITLLWWFAAGLSFAALVDQLTIETTRGSFAFGASRVLPTGLAKNER